MKKHLQLLTLCLFLLFIIVQKSPAQWIQTSGPAGGLSIHAFAKNGNAIFAGSIGDGIYRSFDAGKNWTNVYSDPDFLECITSIVVSDSTVFAGTASGLLRSIDNGNNWNKVSTGLPAAPLDDIYGLAAANGKVYAGTPRGIFRSIDNGDNWFQVASELPKGSVFDIAVKGDTVCMQINYVLAAYPSHAYGPYLSTNCGESWNAIDSGFVNTFGERRLSPIIFKKNALVAGENGVFMSTNMGASWDSVNYGLSNREIRAFAVNDSIVFTGTQNGVFLLRDNEKEWKKASVGEPFRDDVYTLLADGDDLFAGTYEGVFYSDNNGSTWSERNSGIINTQIEFLAVSGNNLIAGTHSRQFFSSDTGKTWTAMNSGMLPGLMTNIIEKGNRVFTGIYDDSGTGIFLSTDNGKTWSPYRHLDVSGKLFEVAGDTIFAGTADGVSITVESGPSLTNSKSGFPADNFEFSFIRNGSTIFARYAAGVYRSFDNGLTWFAADEGLPKENYNTLVACDGTLFIGTEKGIYRSTDNGTQWTSSCLTNGEIFSFLSSDSCIFAITSQGVIVSIDRGITWREVNTVSANSRFRSIASLATNGNTLFAGTKSAGVWYIPLKDALSVNKRQCAQNSCWTNVTVLQHSASNGTERFSFTLKQQEYIALTIYTLTGRKIASIVNRTLGAGEHSVLWNCDHSSTAVYVAKITTGTGFSYSCKFNSSNK